MFQFCKIKNCFRKRDRQSLRTRFYNMKIVNENQRYSLNFFINIKQFLKIETKHPHIVFTHKFFSSKNIFFFVRLCAYFKWAHACTKRRTESDHKNDNPNLRPLIKIKEILWAAISVSFCGFLFVYFLCMIWNL